MSSPPAPVTGQGLALDRLARLLAGELALLAGLADEVQGALARCEFVAPPPAPVMRGLQGIDRIAQGLDDLSRLVATLPPEAIGSIRIPASSLVGLVSGLRQRELRVRITDITDPRHEVPASPRIAAGRDTERPALATRIEAGSGEITWF